MSPAGNGSRAKLRRLLSLDRAVDHGKDLARADPAPGIDEHADDAPALAGDSDGLVAAGAERSAGGDHTADLALTRHDDRDRRHLPGGLASRWGGLRLLPATAQDDV